MSLLIESIKLLDGQFFNLDGHAERMNRSRAALFNAKDRFDLEEFIKTCDYPQRGLYKCRIVYDDRSLDVSFDPYVARDVRRVKVVRDNRISYDYKLADRSAINRLFDMRTDCDDVLIVKKGHVTDCSYSNVVFRKGLKWFTPDTPLLEGTLRARLLREGRIKSREILEVDIRSFDGMKIINAMLEFAGPEIDVSDIVF